MLTAVMLLLAFACGVLAGAALVLRGTEESSRG